MEEKNVAEVVEAKTVCEDSINNETFNQDTKSKLQRFELKTKDIVFSVLFLVSSVIFSSFGLWGGFRAGFTLASLVLFAVLTAYLFKKESKITPFSFISAFFVVVLSCSFAVTSNASVRFWSFTVIFVLSLIWFCSLVKKCEKDDYALISTVFLSLFSGALPHLPNSVISLFSGENKHRKTVGRVLLGIAMAIPVLLVVVPLLMISDEAFSGMTKKLTANVATSVLQLFVGIIITPFIISYAFYMSKKEMPPVKKRESKGAENSVIISFLSVLSCCYLAYLFSQLAYFFSAFSGFLPKDYSFTVSAYARRGFFEMCIIAAINFLIIFLCLIFSRKENGKICIASRILCTFIGFFTLIIIATALSKMFLYIKSFGMTELRITTSAFMIFLSVTFIALMIKIFVARIRVLRVALVTAATVLALLGLFNVNSIIGWYNYNAYIKGELKTIDVNAIYDLGDEGVPYLVKLTNDTDLAVSDTAKQRLKNAYTYGEYYIHGGYYNGEYKDGVFKITEKRFNGLSEYSVSRSRAYKALDEYLKANPEILVIENEYPEDYY